MSYVVLTACLSAIAMVQRSRVSCAIGCHSESELPIQREGSARQLKIPTVTQTVGFRLQ